MSQPAERGGYGLPAPETDGNAIAALVLAILSYVVFPVVPAIVALFLAGRAKRSIEASCGRRSGVGLVRAARVISWIEIGLVALFVFSYLFLGLIVGGGASGSSSVHVGGWPPAAGAGASPLTAFAADQLAPERAPVGDSAFPLEYECRPPRDAGVGGRMRRRPGVHRRSASRAERMDSALTRP
jgi:hypothetical protein